jgi:hypothetical protein
MAQQPTYDAIGRVPHVRQSVSGTKMMGRNPNDGFRSLDQQTIAE